MPKLAKQLHVSAGLAADWASGVHPIPDFVFLKIIDVLLDHLTANDLAELAAEDSDPVNIAARAARAELARIRDLGKKDCD